MVDFIRRYKKYIILGVCVIVAAIVAFLQWSELQSLAKLLSEGSVEDVVSFIQHWGMWAPVVSILLMVLQAFIAPIPSFLIAGANGLVFGVFDGILISWFGAMLGAAGTFYLARVLDEDFVKRFEQSSGLMKKVDEISQKYGAKVIFVGRLLPFVSFDFLSYAAGLSTMKAWQFFLATALGMIPGTVAYVLLGNEIMKYSRYSRQIIWITFAAIALLLVYSTIKKKLVKVKNGK